LGAGSSGAYKRRSRGRIVDLGDVSFLEPYGSRHFVVGLRNAYAMEAQARELIERQSEMARRVPEVKAKVSAHLQETNVHS